MALDYVPTVDPVGPDATIVGPLRSRETILGPTKWVVILVQEGVFLLNSKPRFMLLRPRNSLSYSK